MIKLKAGLQHLSSVGEEKVQPLKFSRFSLKFAATTRIQNG
jgi:hypothetical protein